MRKIKTKKKSQPILCWLVLLPFVVSGDSYKSQKYSSNEGEGSPNRKVFLKFVQKCVCLVPAAQTFGIFLGIVQQTSSKDLQEEEEKLLSYQDNLFGGGWGNYDLSQVVHG